MKPEERKLLRILPEKLDSQSWVHRNLSVFHGLETSALFPTQCLSCQFSKGGHPYPVKFASVDRSSRMHWWGTWWKGSLFQIPTVGMHHLERWEKNQLISLIVWFPYFHKFTKHYDSFAGASALKTCEYFVQSKYWIFYQKYHKHMCTQVIREMNCFN